MKSLPPHLLVVAVAVLAGSLAAQPPDRPQHPEAGAEAAGAQPPDGTSPSGGMQLPEAPPGNEQVLGELAKRWLGESEFGAMVGETAADLIDNLHLLRGLSVEPKTFEKPDGSGDVALGLSYAYARQLVTITESDADSLALSLNLHARGNVAFDPDLNPDDFLETGVSLDLFQAFGGISKGAAASLSEAQKDALAKARQDAMAKWANGTTEERRKLRRQIIDEVAAAAPTEVFWKLKLHGTLESDQTFSQRQPTFGVVAQATVKSLDPDAAIGQLNVLDYPFALLRMLTIEGVDHLEPSSEYWPMLLVGVDLVDPDQVDEREGLVGAEDPYARLRLEAGFSTLAGHLGEMPLKFGLSYRLFQELAAPSSVRAADLDRQQYFAAQVEASNGLTLRYVDGRLPLDRRDDSYFEVGFHYSF